MVLIEDILDVGFITEYVDGAGGLAISLELSGSARKEDLYTVDH